MSGMSPAPTAGGGHEPLRRGWLRNGNAPGDPNTAPRCGAHTRAGAACRAPAMSNGRCRMHGGASTGPCTLVGRAICGQVRRKHPAWLVATRHHPRAANRAARLARGMADFARVWTNPWRRPKALLRLLHSVGHLLPDRPDPWADVATREMARYIRPALNDVLRWLGEKPLAPRERPDSDRVVTALAGAVDACGIGASVYTDLRRRALRQFAQRRRRAAKAVEQGRPVKPTSAAHAEAPHTPRESSRDRRPLARIMSGQDPRGPLKPAFAARSKAPHTPRDSLGRSAGAGAAPPRPDLPASSSPVAGTATSRQDTGASTKERGPLARIVSGWDALGPLKPIFVASMEGPHAPRAVWRSPLARPPPVTASSPWAAGAGVC
jgi:hypothetical protein